MADDPTLSDVSSALSSGDVVLMYTDGLLDAYAPARAYRTADVAAVLSSCAGLSARETGARIEHALLDVDDAAPRDDIAILVLRRS